MSWGRDVFDRIYAADPDPWRFETSDYERGKYAATLALLPPGRPARALELGCSIGVFTALLAARCDAVLGVDCAEAALDRARKRVPSPTRFEAHLVPTSFPDGVFDLVVVSELLYFLAPPDIDALAARVGAALLPGGTVLLANWTGPTDTPSTGEAAADRFVTTSARWLRPVRTLRAATYRLDALRQRSGGRADGAPEPHAPADRRG